ncbi:hypothetical protein Tco_1322667 [Tanacetum coccineum]
MQLLMMLVKRLMKNQQIRVKEMVKRRKGGASNKEDDQNVQDFRAELDNLLVQQKQGYANSTNRVSTVNPSVRAELDNLLVQQKQGYANSTNRVSTISPSIRKWI